MLSVRNTRNIIKTNIIKHSIFLKKSYVENLDLSIDLRNIYGNVNTNVEKCIEVKWRRGLSSSDGPKCNSLFFMNIYLYFRERDQNNI